MARIVNVHHVDYPSFEKGDAEYGDPEELVLVFGTSPSLVEVVEEVRRKLKWMDESDVVELVGRYNVGFGHIRWKTMSLNSELHWEAYKESVLASEVKSLELFARKKVGARLHIDLNRRASPSQASSPVRDDPNVNPDVYDTTMSQQPPMTQDFSPIRNDQYDHHGLDMDGHDDVEGGDDV